MCFIGFSIPEYLVAITDRGEWTISMIFEIYLGFAGYGDQYLCNSDDFPFFIQTAIKPVMTKQVNKSLVTSRTLKSEIKSKFLTTTKDFDD